MRAVAVLFAGLLVLSSAAHAQSNKDWNDCASEDTDRSLTGCSAIIARGKETKINLAIARANRGNDYQNKGDHKQAIADYDESIRLNPKEANTYHNRGYSQAELGEYDLAIADYSRR